MAVDGRDSDSRPDDEPERAQLWSVYFGLRSLSHPPPFLVVAQQELWRYLDELDESPPAPPLGSVGDRSHLQLVRS